MLLPHVFHLEVFWETLVCGLPNQNQVVNGYKIREHEEIRASIIWNKWRWSIQATGCGLRISDKPRITKAQLPVGTFVNNLESGTWYFSFLLKEGTLKLELGSLLPPRCSIAGVFIMAINQAFRCTCWGTSCRKQVYLGTEDGWLENAEGCQMYST